MIRCGRLFWLSGLASFGINTFAIPALAQATIFAPCLTASSNIADIRAGFVASGWVEVTDGPARMAAEHTLGEPLFLVTRFPAKPRTAAKLDSLMQLARTSAEQNLRGSSLFRQGDIVADCHFAPDPESHRFSCQISAPLLPEVTAAMMLPKTKTRDDMSFVQFDEVAPVNGIEKVVVQAFRYAPPFATTDPITGLDSLFVYGVHIGDG